MYIIEKTKFGFKFTFVDLINIEEMKEWVEALKRALLLAPPEFSVFLDVRMLKPLESECQECIRKAESLCKKLGMKRSAIIYNNTLIRNQFKWMAQESGVDEFERRIDASQVKNWENVGLNWVLEGVDPDSPT